MLLESIQFHGPDFSAPDVKPLQESVEFEPPWMHFAVLITCAFISNVGNFNIEPSIRRSAMVSAPAMAFFLHGSLPPHPGSLRFSAALAI